MKIQNKFAFCIVSTAILLGSQAISAANVLEEIVVTATKRGDESLQDIPIAISALKGDDLSKIGATVFGDYARSVPGLGFQDQGPGDKKYLVRGIGSSSSSAVGVYLDEAVLTANNPEDGGGRNADLKLYDIERIEVLRGPQGTLYGASSFGGTIRMITNKPGFDEVSGHVEAELSSTDNGSTNSKVHGVLNIPLIEDKLAVRAVLWNEDADGFIDNTRLGLEDVNDEDTSGGRLALGWLPTEDLSITLKYTSQDTSVGARQRAFHNNPQRDVLFGTNGAFAPSTQFEGELENGDFNLDPFMDDFEIIDLTAEWQIDAGVLTLGTSVFDRDIVYTFDGALLRFFGVTAPGITFQPQNRKISSTELRFSSENDGPINYVIGAFYSKDERNFQTDVCQTVPGQNGVLVGTCAAGPANNAQAFGGTGASFFHRVLTGSSDQQAFFGEVSYQISDNLRLDIGARYFEFDIAESRTTTHNFGDGSMSLLPDGVASESKTTFKSSLSYNVSDDITIYGVVAEGFRQGGLNPANISIQGTTTEIPQFYSSDEIINYELGLKASWLDRKVTTDVVLYHIDWTDIQSREFDLSPFIVNAGEASVNGLEIEVNALLTGAWTTRFSFGYTDAELTETPIVTSSNANGVTFQDAGVAGDPFPNVPELTASFALQYDFELGGNPSYARLDWTYTDDSRTQFSSSHAYFERLDDYSLVNLNLGMELKHFDVRFFIDNLTDERAQVNRTFFEQEEPATFVNRPVTYGASLRYNF